MVGGWQGMVIGVSVAAPVGPMAVLCVRRSVLFGRAVGLATGLGVASAHALYSAVAMLGLGGVSDALAAHGPAVRAAGAVIVAGIGLRMACARPPVLTGEGGRLTRRAAYGTAFGLCLANPLTVVSLAGLFAGLDPVSASGGLRAPLLVLGVFVGSSLWWLVLTGSAGVVGRGLTTARLRRFNRGAGACLVVLAGLIASGA